MAARAMPCRTGCMHRLGNWNQGSIAQIRREHQHQRRNDAKREKRVQRRQDAAQVARRTDRKPPGNRARGQSGQGRDRARTGRDLQPRAALRALDIVRARRRFRRGNFRLAMRTHANGHVSPPNENAYNNRNRVPRKRKDGWAIPIKGVRVELRREWSGTANGEHTAAAEPLFTLAT
jgi:hypothetical protein